MLILVNLKILLGDSFLRAIRSSVEAGIERAGARESGEK